MAKRWFAVALGAVTLLHLALAAWLPPADDELYYWCWSKPLEFSYYDHPGMSAWWIRLSTAVFGDTLFAVRLPACLGSLGAMLILARLTPGRGLLAALLLTPFFCFGAILLTPDAPLLFFWTAYVAWLVAAHRRLSAMGNGEWGMGNGRPMGFHSPFPIPHSPFWALGGLLLGLGLLSKYTMGLAVPAAGLSFLAVRPWRRWAGGFALHLAVAFVTASPILIYNVQHGFAPLRYQWGHTMASYEPPAWHYLPEFVGVQTLLIGLVPFTALPWVLWRRRRLCADPGLRACFWMYALPMVFFLAKAARGPLEANWPLVAYVSLWPLAHRLLADAGSARLWRLTYAGFALPAACTLVLAVHLAAPFRFVTPEKDRLTRQFQVYATARRMGDYIRDVAPGRPVYIPSYQWTALMRFQHVDARQVPGWMRPSQFTAHPSPLNPDEPTLLLSEGPLPEDLARQYGPPEVLAMFPLRVRGALLTHYILWRYPPKGGGALAAAGRP
jgi:4-amino-4-deoxy-L-arabinose transferase-like glycosyltransferase